MNAAETIAAAIHVLDDFKKSSTSPGGWVVVEDSIRGTERKYQPLLDAGDFAASSERFENPVDAMLVVTLHRTLDAQLAILRHALARARSKIATGGGERSVWTHEIDAQNLARAILGEPS